MDPCTASLLLVLAQVPMELRSIPKGCFLLERAETAFHGDALELSYRWDFGRRSIERRDSESDESGHQRQNSWRHATPYEVSAVCCRVGGSELFVAGLEDDGDVVIERFVFPQREGGWRHVPPAMRPIGTPMGRYVGRTAIKGGWWREPSADPVTTKRTTILESDAYQCIRGMEVDPEGRFLLFQDHADGALYRVRMDRGAIESPELLYTLRQIPALMRTVFIDRVEMLEKQQRAWILHEPKNNGTKLAHLEHVLLWDDENDGEFDRHAIIGYVEYMSLTQGGSGHPHAGPEVQSACPWLR